MISDRGLGAQDRGFTVTYREDDDTRSVVTVRTGYGEALPEVDYQVVEFENDRLDFTVSADVANGLIRSLTFATPGAPPRSLEQRHLRTSRLIHVIREWAQLGRELQLLGDGVDWRNGEVQLPDGTNFWEAVAGVRASLSGWMPESQPRRRAAGPEANELLRRVVDRYRELVDAGHRSPRKVIAAEENYHPAHIGRLLVKARKQGLLEAARPGVAGEIEDTENQENDE